MSGLDPEFGIKMMEIKVVEINAYKKQRPLTGLKLTRSQRAFLQFASLSSVEAPS